MEHGECRWTVWKHRTDVKAGFLESQFTHSASSPNAKNWKGEGRKGRGGKYRVHTLLSVNFTVREGGESRAAAGDFSGWKGVEYRGRVITEVVELRCSKCRDEKQSILIK